MNAKKALTYLAFFGIGIGLFWLAMQGVEDPEALKRDMSSASWWGIAASFVMGYLAIVSRGLRWNLLLAPNGHKASPSAQRARGGLFLFLQRLRPEVG